MHIIILNVSWRYEFSQHELLLTWVASRRGKLQFQDDWLCLYYLQYKQWLACRYSWRSSKEVPLHFTFHKLFFFLKIIQKAKKSRMQPYCLLNFLSCTKHVRKHPKTLSFNNVYATLLNMLLKKLILNAIQGMFLKFESSTYTCRPSGNVSRRRKGDLKNYKHCYLHHTCFTFSTVKKRKKTATLNSLHMKRVQLKKDSLRICMQYREIKH